MRKGGLIELRRGGQRKLFLVHDGEGETLVYLNLARHLTDELAVFAIEPRHIERVPLAHTTIEDMAAFYIEEIRKQQPQGPYLLGGLCAGGVIAYEMAVQLIRAGERVDLVALLESVTPGAPERPRRIRKQRLHSLKQAIAHSKTNGNRTITRATLIVGAFSKKLWNVLLWETSQRARRWSVSARFRLLRVVLRRKLAWPKFLPELTPREIYDSAHIHHKPKTLSNATVVLIRAKTGEGDDTPYRNIYLDETFGWNGIANSLTIVDVEGGHATMLEERFVDSIAKVLLPYLQQSTAQIHSSV